MEIKFRLSPRETTSDLHGNSIPCQLGCKKSQICLYLSKDLHLSQFQFLIRCMHAIFKFLDLLCILLHVLRRSTTAYNDYYLRLSATFLCFSFYNIQQREIKTHRRVAPFIYQTFLRSCAYTSTFVSCFHYKTHSTIRRIRYSPRKQLFDKAGQQKQLLRR